MKPKIIKQLKQLINLLVTKQYDTIIKTTKQNKLTADEIKNAIDDFGETLIMPENFKNIDIIEVKNDKTKQWSVDFDLWTQESGVSDLTLQLTLFQNSGNELEVIIDDIHVL